MAKLTPEMQDLIRYQPIGFVATVGADGQPNVSPKGALKIVDDETLAFADLFSLKTRANLAANPAVAVAIADLESYEGYQFRGRAELLERGPIYDEVAALFERPQYGPQPLELLFEKAVRGLAEALKRANRSGYRPRNVILVHIEEIWNLAPGHESEVWR